MEIFSDFFVSRLAGAALAVFLFMFVMFLYALVRRNNGLADVAWGIGFVVAALAVLWFNTDIVLRQLLVTALVSIWGVRLALHVWLRIKGNDEDWRYARWRRTWGEHWLIRSFLQVFMLQGFLMLVISLPVLYVNAFGGPSLGGWDLAGAAVWVVGFIWESVSDHQLARFKKNPENRGRVLQSGLWRYSRHPNYFGEVCMWWGLWLIASAVPGGWATFIGPGVLTFLIIRISGVALLERHFAANPEYLDYRRRTSMFFPWFPGR
ncbi:MAG TPA: DUF1295 domain-containing protein [Candidatus Paceibacterota bacterium]|nr:DUF1295 domain-containing protein [Candidatus Paceibacterota bacterium]